LDSDNWRAIDKTKIGFFDVEPDSPDIPITIPTKVRSKCMRRHKGMEQMEEGGSLAKVTQK